MRIVVIGRIAGVRAVKESAGTPPAARVSFAAAERDYAAGWLDAATGCEFVDDRIRLMESGEDEWQNER
jgi:hypothetical protein